MKAIKNVEDLGKHLVSNEFFWHKDGEQDATSAIRFLSDGIIIIKFLEPPKSSFLGIWELVDERTLWYTVEGWPYYTIRFNEIGTEAVLISPVRVPPSKMKIKF